MVFYGRLLDAKRPLIQQLAALRIPVFHETLEQAELDALNRRLKNSDYDYDDARLPMLVKKSLVDAVFEVDRVGDLRRRSGNKLVAILKNSTARRKHWRNVEKQLHAEIAQERKERK